MTQTRQGTRAPLEGKRQPHFNAHLLFAGIVLVFVVWVLSLPVFPTQDGPMHRYYIHVLDAVLHGSKLYGVYRVRHPFPPYATHYGLLLVLSHLMSYDLAEKLFTILIVVCFAYGLRFCAMSCGRAGDTVSLFAAPLFLHWALMMGFMNYSLALGIFLFIAGCWQRASAGQVRYWLPFAVLVCLLTVTHPVPLLILIALCTLDLLLRAFVLRGRSPWSSSRIGLAVTALVFCFLAFKIPAASLQKGAATTVFADMGFHARITAQTMLLAGVSPYYAVTHSLLLNLYRLILYAIFVGSMVVGFRALHQHLASRQLVLSDTFWISTVLLALAIPFLPDYVNGSGFFSTRMMVFLWMGALVAASGADEFSWRTQQILRVSAAAAAAVSLLAAQLEFRPVAVKLAQVEQLSIPGNRNSLLLTGPNLDDYVHHTYQIAFDPFAWGPSLALIHANDVILDSPWIDQNIAPLQAVPGSPLLVDDIKLTHLSKIDPGFRPGASLPESRAHGLLDRSSVLLYSDTPGELEMGIGEQLEPAYAARYTCSRHAWYIVCLEKP